MSLFSKRPQQQEPIGRRRPAPTQPQAGQNRTFSYYASRSSSETNIGRLVTQQEAPKRRRSQRARAFAHHLPFIIVTVALVFGALSQLDLSGKPKIVVVSSASSEGGKLFLRPQADYEDAAAKLFSKTFSNHNKLTVDASGIAAAFQKQFPELNDVSVTLPMLGRRPTVNIQPSTPTMILAASNGKFVLDDNGRAMLNATHTTAIDALHLPTVTDQSGVPVHPGQIVLPSNESTFVQTILTQLRAQHISTGQIVLPAAASEVDVHIASQPYFIKFNVQNAALPQAGSAVATMRHLTARGVTPRQYIDVRIDDRAYYK